MSTNVSVVMLTLNEAENIEDTLDSAEPCFDELVLVDGGSTDWTVQKAEAWCQEHDKDFQVVSSTEREYLLEGPATQRRRGADAATNDYIMALGADVEVVVHDEEWFQRDFDHYAYSHTRVKASGHVESDWRLYHKDPPFDPQADWRGMVHEELRLPNGTHVSEAYKTAEAPMEHHQQRHGAMDTKLAQGRYQHRWEGTHGGRSRSLKKQHFLLAQAMGSRRQKRHLYHTWRRYFNEQQSLVMQDAKEIAEEFDIPLHTEASLRRARDANPVPWWDLEEGDPIMSYSGDTALTYGLKKAAEKLGLTETVY